MNITAIGWAKFRKLRASATMRSGSPMSASMYPVTPSGVVLVSNARAWVSTSGSLSTETILDWGATLWATSCVFSMVGRPVPMSRNWRMPSSAASVDTARMRNRRDCLATVTMPGLTAITASPASRSIG
jgi:hypothetical protein